MTKRTKNKRKLKISKAYRKQVQTAFRKSTVDMTKKPFELEHPYIPVIGDLVTIVESSVNYAPGKNGVVEDRHGEGWAVRIKTRKVNAQDYGTLERHESDNVVFCSKLKPYIP